MEISAQQILNSKLINKANLARKMWPNAIKAPQKLSDKLSNIQSKRLTDNDKSLIVETFLAEFNN